MPAHPPSSNQLERSPDIELEFLRSSGPGGQNVNKLSTAVRLRFAVNTTPLLPEDVRRRLIALAGSRMTEQGEMIIEARRFRTQDRNRIDALRRLAEFIAVAWQAPRPRRPTKPTRAAKQRRLDLKKRRGCVKQSRQMVRPENE
ncbi:MAG: aminoacyl-tRNA hydrolase [Desulfovibrionales bacterium]|nr:MAG: aminoacyl-tRNA hydrolase [Desulfovibrionales bacterium]